MYLHVHVHCTLLSESTSVTISGAKHKVHSKEESCSSENGRGYKKNGNKCNTCIDHLIAT